MGKQIAKYRIAANLTQESLTVKLQLAGLDMERTGIAKIEGRIRSVFDYELYVIARVLGVEIRDFFPKEEEFHDDLPKLLKGHIWRARTQAPARARRPRDV